MQGACQSLERGKLKLDSSRDARSGNNFISTAEKGKGAEVSPCESDGDQQFVS